MDDSFRLEPRYTSREISGRCLKCLAEQEINNCLMLLLQDENDDDEIKKKYEALVSFLQSPQSQQLREESERQLADGKKVSVKITFEKGRPGYELVIE